MMSTTTSRCHTLVQITVNQKTAEGEIRVSRLTAIDLAGSEKIKKTSASGLAL